MGDSANTQKTQVSIASGEDMVAALRHPDSAIRTAVLRAIMENPQAAMAYGEVNGRDLVDELLALCDETRGTAERWSCVCAVLSLDDPRGGEVAKEAFLTSDPPQIALLAASRLATLPAADRIAFLSPVVMGPGRQIRCRAAANLLADCRNLEPAVAIRVATLSDHEAPLPPLTEGTLEAWLAELQGPYPQKTKNTLLQRGSGALEALMAMWDRLPEPLRIWIMGQGIERHTPGIAALIRDTIRRESGGELLRVALETLPGLVPEEADEGWLAPLCTHDDPSIRAAAIAAESAPRDWWEALKTEPSRDVRLAMITRIARCGHADDVAPLVRLLADGDWRIRARVTDALVALAPASLPALRTTLEHGSEGARVAAAQALYRLECAAPLAEPPV